MMIYDPVAWLTAFSDKISSCTNDILVIVKSKEYSVLSQMRAYAILEEIGDIDDFIDRIKLLEVQVDSAYANKVLLDLSMRIKTYSDAYLKYSEELEKLYDVQKMKQLAKSYAKPWEKKYEKAKKEYEKAKELWELAKETYEIYNTKGFLARYFALRKLRNKAGFRVESDRLGNYVTRTFDLMQQAQITMRNAELDMYANNIDYKCNGQVYTKIYELLRTIANQ